MTSEERETGVRFVMAGEKSWPRRDAVLIKRYGNRRLYNTET
jgi:hypothetical protein